MNDARRESFETNNDGVTKRVVQRANVVLKMNVALKSNVVLKMVFIGTKSICTVSKGVLLELKESYSIDSGVPL